jgi:RNA polymerase sigma factor (sigma-70 family)
MKPQPNYAYLFTEAGTVRVILVDALNKKYKRGYLRLILMETDILQQLYFSHAKKIHRYLKSLCHSEDRAFDMMQETFLAADRYYKPGAVENPEAWLIGIARNIFKKEAKREQKFIPTDVSELQIADTRQEEPQKDFQLLRENIDAKLASADPLLAEIFALRLDMDFTHAQIASALELPLITVRRHFEKIKALIEQNFSSDLREP